MRSIHMKSSQIPEKPQENSCQIRCRRLGWAKGVGDLVMFDVSGGSFRKLVEAGQSAAQGVIVALTFGLLLATGFALVGWPARYNETGLMTFIVNQDGAVYQKHLGPNSASVAGAMTRFDPDASWTALPAP